MIELPNGFFLSEVNSADRSAYLEWLNDPWFSQVIPIMPYPYTEESVDAWMRHAERRRDRNAMDTSLAIREPAGKLIGGVGVEQVDVGKDHKAEFGYWLARPYWGAGVMTNAVRAFVQFAFSDLQLERLYAHVLDFNTGSRRVLEKCGFQQEGLLRQHLRTSYGVYDTYIYGRLKTD